MKFWNHIANSVSRTVLLMIVKIILGFFFGNLGLIEQSYDDFLLIWLSKLKNKTKA